MKNKPIPLAEGVRQVKAGILKPSEWAEECLTKIDAFDKTLKAWAYVDPEQVMRQALQLDAEDWGTFKPSPFLAGAPIGVKDIFNTIDHPNSMGSPTREGYWPGNDARVVTAAKLGGAQIIGKTTTAEFAVHTAPKTLNPWCAQRIPGTSSTGSAVAVATGMVPAALATQSAGSIARPASYNGVFGFKPSFGMVPRTGILKTCDTFDTVGWMTRNVDDSILLLEALRARGRNYPIVEKNVAAFAETYSGKKNYILGKIKSPGYEEITDDSLAKWDKLLFELGNKKSLDVVSVDGRSMLVDVHEIHQTIYDKSLAYYFRKELSDVQFISPVFREIVDRAQFVEPGDYFSALNVQEKLIAEASNLFGRSDFVCLPTTAGEAPLIGSNEKRDSSLIWTLLGLPMISVPLLRGPTELPVGITFVGKKYCDYELLSFVRDFVMNEDSEVVSSLNLN